ncbi:MAG: zf-HC2 domain-containing protein [bacterium]|nr:zf-HC2 domain-containing protein [bacterium]
MIRCLLVQWWMDEYLDGVLGEKLTQWVETHLRQCPQCAQELAWRRSLQHTLKLSSSAVPSSQEMWRDFQRRIAQRHLPARPLWVSGWRLQAVSLALAGVIVAGFLWWSTQMPQPHTVSSLAEPSPSQEAPRVASGVAPSSVKDRQEKPPAPSPQRPASVASARQTKPAPTPPVTASASSQLASPSEAREPQLSAPQVVASIAYAEVRDAQGELVSQVFLQTTYDQNGQPRTVQIEMTTPTFAEGETDGQVEDSSSFDSAPRDDSERPLSNTDDPLGIPD